ncbi:S-layer homology domain-containing protein [Paenibacillus sp. HN-1]|uniref:S-layer homology domain-containing protein n=1 Tax=Paenibacillus TaxID=44249 RepID=UPI001CA920B4|nr:MULTISPECIES: S-layer homology domain-containing protein [Paenibacillus]MBY9082447.1 S-layer homology domain-containing protein [Paenibacillus sp. CGMCC 1.18879]MBY9084806.1 S-layer homology domain-containing protein [Paenibacillus sinensis]
MFQTSDVQAASLYKWSKVSTTGLESVAFGNGTYVGVTSAGNLAVSDDLLSWQNIDVSALSLRSFAFVTFVNGKFFAGTNRGDSVPETSPKAFVLMSDDGRQWTAGTGANTYSTYAFSTVAYGNGNYWLASSNGGGFLKSPDGVFWTNAGISGLGRINDVQYLNGSFIGLTTADYVTSNIVTSADGASWTTNTSGIGSNLNRLYSDGSLVLAGGSQGKIYKSPQGSDIPTIEASISGDLMNGTGYAANFVSFAFGAGQYMAVSSNNGVVAFSNNGMQWSTTSLSSASLRAAFFKDNTFFICSRDGVYKRVPASRPLIVTGAATDITSDSAVIEAEVTSVGSDPVTERGVVYGTVPEPTTSDAKAVAGLSAEAGTFSAALNGLDGNTVYYARAYAVNEVGVAYGAEISFTTLEPNRIPTAGSLSFSVTSGTYFAGELPGSDLDGDTLTYTITSQGTQGTVRQAQAGSGAFTYTPELGAIGSDSFTYTVTDGKSAPVAGTVLVTILPSGAAGLTSLQLQSVALAPDFDPDILSYTATVANSVYSTTVTASVYGSGAKLLVNGLPYNGETIALEVGANVITVSALAQDGVTEKQYQVEIERQEEALPPTPTPEASPSPEASPTPSPTSEPTVAPNPSAPSTAAGIKVVIDGVAQELSATVRMNEQNGRTQAMIEVDNDKVIRGLTENKQNVLIGYTNPADSVVVELNGQLVKVLESKQSFLQIVTDKGVYNLPANLLKIDDISSSLGHPQQLSDIKLSIELGSAKPADVQALEASASKQDYTIMGPTLEFNIKAVYNGNSVNINRFSAYVERSIILPQGMDGSQITTAVVLNSDGTVSHIPTKVTVVNGRYTASINSLTNSTYALVWKPATAFLDTERRWSRQDIAEMDSRYILEGTGNNRFEPQRGITRAEYAAAVVRAFGLRTEGLSSVNGQTASFTDVSGAAWYAEPVSVAAGYGLINGYKNGGFQPNSPISRGEASVVLARALKLANLESAGGADAVQAELSKFKDGAAVPAFARESAALGIELNLLQGEGGYLNLKAGVTREETAALLNRALKAAGLI